MGISINITTEGDGLSVEDVKILQAIVAGATGESPKAPVSAPKEESEAPTPTAKSKRPRKAAQPAPEDKDEAVAKVAEAEPEPEPEPEPADDEADEPDEADAAEGPTMKDAVTAATGKMAEPGGSAKVKAALAEFGAKRVSELKAGDLGGFIDALNG